DVWFRQDVARILASTQETLAQAQCAVPPLDPERAGAYQQGFADALQVVAVAFGLSATAGVPDVRRERVVDVVSSWPAAGPEQYAGKNGRYS
ncbi:MAG: hypothetical protein ACK2U9_22640, partial [Anaerolineae bacterium]